VARSGSLGLLLSLLTSGLVLSACYALRPVAADRTNWDELPNDPRPELWVEGSPRVAVVLDGVYSATGDSQPSFDAQSTQYYLSLLRQSHVFTQVMDREPEPGQPRCRVRMERTFQEDAHTGANLTMAATVPGLLGYRFGLVATLKLQLERPDGAPLVYEARSRITHIYYSSARTTAARLLVYREADRANTDAILHQLRADPNLFDPVTPLSDAARGSVSARP
jgi:hypothetical protein